MAYLDHVINYLGAITIEGLFLPFEEDLDAITRAEPAVRDLGRKLVQAIHEKPGNVQQKAIIRDNQLFFQSIIRENKTTRPEEYQRWVRMGWISEIR